VAAEPETPIDDQLPAGRQVQTRKEAARTPHSPHTGLPHLTPVFASPRQGEPEVVDLLDSDNDADAAGKENDDLPVATRRGAPRAAAAAAAKLSQQLRGLKGARPLARSAGLCTPR